MKNTKIIIKTKSKSYPIYFGNEILSLTGSLIKKNIPKVKKICIIVDKKLPSIILKKLIKSLKKYKIIIIKLNSSEKIKNFSVANKLILNLLNNNFNRSDCIVALGGGVLGDLSAFVASITKRGLKFINIPTTLLSQVDASIGGKTGVNSKQGKNLIGTFYQPDFVLSDLSTLKSLPRREIICGYGEILKHSLILDKKFFLWLLKNGKQIINSENIQALKYAIIQSCKIKSKVVSADEKEKDLRTILNFGHTFAHGFEGAKNFSKALNHGEAVLLGIIMASEFSYERKILPKKDLILIKKHYNSLSLTLNIKKIFKKVEVNKIVYFAKKDKKNVSNKINLILIKKIGKILSPSGFNITTNEFKKFLLSRWK